MSLLVLAMASLGAGPLGIGFALAAAPTASNVSGATDEDVTEDIALACTDPDGDALTYSITTDPTNGSVTIVGSSGRYTPDPDWSGSDSFRYRCTDSTGANSGNATVNVTVARVNDAPTADPQSVSTSEDTPVAITPTGADAEGDALTFSISTAPSHGSATVSRGIITYTPEADYVGTDTLRFVAVDTSGATSSAATITITISDANDVPVANAATVETDEDETATITLSATDPEGDPITYALARVPTDGSATLVGNVVTYVPNADWNGMDNFTFIASDASGSSTPATVTITVRSVNDVPTVADRRETVDEDGNVTVWLTATDVDGTSPTFSIVDSPANGGVMLSGSSVIYRPSAEFFGTDTFTYMATDDAFADSNIGTVTVTVNPVADPPVAYPSVGHTPQHRPVWVEAPVLDPDSISVALVLDTQPNHGRLVKTSHGFRYTPNIGFYGVDRWTWHANDGTTSSDTVTMQVNVHPRPMLNRPDMPQIGLNRVQFELPTDGVNGTQPEPQFEPEAIFADFDALGVQVYRQMTQGDTVWSTLELGPGNFRESYDNPILPNGRYEPTVTLFELQYASPTSPYCVEGEPFEKFLGPDAYRYLDHVVGYYTGWLNSYEIGNEMYHWVAADGLGGGDSQASELPECLPEDGYAPSEQAVFIEEASRYIRASDEHALITLASVNTSGDSSEQWLQDVVGAAGDTDWFDIISYHSYDSWNRAYVTRENLQDWLDNAGVSNKLVRLTETGSTSDADYIDRTDYPNSDESQCSDIFRLPLIAWAHGDATVLWHTYMPITDAPGGEFQGFEIVEHDGTWKPAAFAFQMMTENLIPFSQVTDYSDNPTYRFHVLTAYGEDRYIFWGEGEIEVPSGVTEYTSVYPDEAMNYHWTDVAEGEVLTLTDTPILLR